MHFDLHSLLGQQNNPEIFQDLEKPFSDEEINQIVKELPHDKSPGPDGFNNEFIQSCWDIIGTDVKNLIHTFHAGNISLESFNSKKRGAYDS